MLDLYVTRLIGFNELFFCYWNCNNWATNFACRNASMNLSFAFLFFPTSKFCKTDYVWCNVNISRLIWFEQSKSSFPYEIFIYSFITKKSVFQVRIVNQGPLITDGRNSCKWTYHCVGLSKSFIMIKISGQKFWKILSNG